MFISELFPDDLPADLAEGWKSVVGGMALAGAVAGGIAATPRVYVDGQVYDRAVISAPDDAKVVTTDDGQKVKAWVHKPTRSIQGRVNHLYVPVNNEVKETKSLLKKVRIVQGQDKGKTGMIRQIKHGLFKGAPKKYDIDLDDGGQSNGLPATALRLIKEEQVAEVIDQRSAIPQQAKDDAREKQMVPIIAKRKKAEKKIMANRPKY